MMLFFPFTFWVTVVPLLPGILPLSQFTCLVCRLSAYHRIDPIKPFLINKNLNVSVTVKYPSLTSSNRGSSMNTFELLRGKSLSHRLCVLSFVHGALWKGEATGWGWDVFNALINVTDSGTSSLMWNRHLESVAHAVKKGWCADGETASCGGFANDGPASVSTLLCPVKRLRLWNLKFKGTAASWGVYHLRIELVSTLLSH